MFSKSFLKLSRFGKIARPISYKAFQSQKSYAAFAKALTATSLVGFVYANPFSSTKVYAQDDTREIETIDASELAEGQLKQVQIGPEKDDVILLYKNNGKYYATGAKCPHLGAPLEKGVAFDEKLYCPWHASAFSVATGMPDQGPVFDNLPVYEVREENGKLYVKVPKDLKKSVEPVMAKRFKANFTRYVILGGGPAALSAAETLRQSGFTGEIMMITKDHDLPYDRTVLSKNMFGAEIEKIQLRSKEFFEKYDIDVLTDTDVKYLNIDKSLLEIDGKDPVKFDKLLIATGGRTKVPAVSGSGLQNVFTLRSYKDMKDIKETVQKSKKIVIVGASFIGMETAANIKKDMKDAVEVIVVDRKKEPFSKVFGEEVGQALKEMHEKNGVKFVLEKQLRAVEGAGSVTGVLLDDNTEIKADMVLLGTGIRPNRDLAENSMRLADDGGIYTDIFMQTSIDGIFAAGDVASYPYWYTGDRIRIEHYNEAIQQGQIAAYNMIGKKIPHNSIPFFWTKQYDTSVRYVGHGRNFDSIYIDGDVKDMKFVAYYGKDNRVVAAATIGRDPAAMIISQAMQVNMMPSMEELKEGKVKVEDIKERIQKKKGCSKCKKKACLEKPVVGPTR